MSKVLFCFVVLCFTAHNLLFVMEERIYSFRKDQIIQADLEDNFYPTVVYKDKKGEYVGVLQTFPQTIVTNFFARTGYLGKKQLSLLLQALLGDIIERENHLIHYFTDPLKSDNYEHTITCHNVLHDELKSQAFDGYFCFSLESNIFAIFNRPINRHVRSNIFLRHLDNHAKEHIINIDEKFTTQSIFLESYFLIVGSYIATHLLPPTVDVNKYHIDIYQCKETKVKANSSRFDVNNIDASYHLSIDIEGTNPDISPNETEKNDPLFKLITITDEYCILQNQITKAFIFILYKNIEKQINIPNASVIYTNNQSEGPKNIN